MDTFRSTVSTPGFLSTVTLPLTIISFVVALLIAAFSPPDVSRWARSYYQASIAAVAFRAWYAVNNGVIELAWWGNLIWLNLMVASVILTGAVVAATTRKRARDRRLDHERA